MTTAATQPPVARSRTPLGGALRDMVSDWNRWSKVERLVVVATVLAVLAAPVFAGDFFFL